MRYKILHLLLNSSIICGGRVISPSQRPLPYNTQHAQRTNIHAPGGIRTHNLSRRAAADLRLRPRGHWDRQYQYIQYTKKYFLHNAYNKLLNGWRISESQWNTGNWEVLKCRISNTLDDNEDDYCLHRMKVQAITTIIACVITMTDIIGHSMISRNFILHSLFVE